MYAVWSDISGRWIAKQINSYESAVSLANRNRQPYHTARVYQLDSNMLKYNIEIYRTLPTTQPAICYKDN